MSGPGYSLEVPWSVDVISSWAFIHDVYWSVAVQGFANVSHGCINTSPAHAETYYKMEEPGDPATVNVAPAASKQHSLHRIPLQPSAWNAQQIPPTRTAPRLGISPAFSLWS
jgi:hypothetical protein